MIALLQPTGQSTFLIMLISATHKRGDHTKSVSETVFKHQWLLLHVHISLHHAPPFHPAVMRTTAVLLVTAQIIKKQVKLHRAEKAPCSWNIIWLIDGISFQPLTIGPLRLSSLYFNIKYYAKVVMAMCLWWDFDGPRVCPACRAECLEARAFFSLITPLIPQKMIMTSQKSEWNVSCLRF